MRRSLPNDVLNNLRCAVIGLGDSSYLRYNVVGKKLYKRLIQLGAQMILDICLGDDQHDLGLDAAVDNWLTNFWSKIDENFDLNLKNDSLTNLNSKLYDVDLVDEKCIDFDTNDEKLDESVVYDQTNYYRSRVISNERLTSEDHFQDTRFIRLHLSSDQSLNYSPGDVVMILPQNSKENVDEFIDLLNLDRNQLIKIRRKNKNFLGFNLYDTIENRPISIEQLVEQYFDLSSVPKRSFFEVLTNYSTDQLEHDKLKEFSSTKGQYALYEYCKRPKRNLLEVLIDFPKTTANLKIEDLVQLINPIFARPYSIASSLRQHPNELHVLCAVKKVKTLLKKPRLGLCSNYLKQLDTDNEVSIYIKKGTLKIPDDKTPLIAISPGTGVAPIRSIIEDRLSRDQTSKDQSSKDQSLNYLFFGCRNRKKDFYFEREWKRAVESGFLNLIVAFSRDQPDRKEYVQDKLWENRQLIWQLINEHDAHLIICGSSSQMPKDVREMLINIVKDQSDDLKDKAESLINRYETIKKLQFECWD